MPITQATDRAELLSKHHLLRHLGSEQIELLARRCTSRRYGAGELIFERGSPGSSLMAVVSGQVKISVMAPDGREAVLNLIGPMSFFGEIALLDGKERTADALALTPCELLVLERRDFLPLIRQSPELALRLIEVLCARLRATSHQVEVVLFQTLPARLAQLLIDLAETNGVATPDGRRIGLKLSQGDIGNMVGSSRESVNRQLSTWHRGGLISFDHGFITLRRPDRLSHLARGS